MILGKKSRKDPKRHQHLLNLGMPLHDAHFCWRHLWKKKKQKKENQWVAQNPNVSWRNVKSHGKGKTKITSRCDVITTTWFRCLSLMVFPMGVVDVIKGMDFSNRVRWCQMFNMSWVCPSYLFKFCFFLVGIHRPYFLLAFKEFFLNPFPWKLYLLLEMYPLPLPHPWWVIDPFVYFPKFFVWLLVRFPCLSFVFV
jgi:hypothetical protein